MTRRLLDRNRRSGGSLAAFATLAALMAAGGCSLKNPHAVGSLERARFWNEHEHYQEAADAYEVFVRQNPTDEQAPQAQFEKALAYMQIKEYPLAAVELQILAQDHPDSPLVEDASFRQGECYYFQVGRLERDVTPAYEARLHWLEFARRYPTSRFMPEVRRYMQEIADLMVRKQMRAVDIYTHLRRPDAAALVLDRILEDEPAASILDEVLLKRAQIALRLDDPDAAAAAYRRLLDEFPESNLRDRATAGLADLAGMVADDDGST